MPELGRRPDDERIGNVQRGFIVCSLEAVPATDEILVGGEQIEIVVFQHPGAPRLFDLCKEFPRWHNSFRRLGGNAECPAEQ